jgi:hypothetical protein
MNKPKANPFFEEVNLASLGVPGLAGMAKMEVHSLCEMMMFGDEPIIDDVKHAEFHLHCHTTDGTWNVEAWVMQENGRMGSAKVKRHVTKAFNTLLAEITKSTRYGTWYLEALAKYVLANDMKDLKREIRKLDAHITKGIFSERYPKDKAELDLETWHWQLREAEYLVLLSKIGVPNELLASARQFSIHALSDMDALNSAMQVTHIETVRVSPK